MLDASLALHNHKEIWVGNIGDNELGCALTSTTTLARIFQELFYCFDLALLFFNPRGFVFIVIAQVSESVTDKVFRNPLIGGLLAGFLGRTITVAWLGLAWLGLAWLGLAWQSL